ncbi:hypothetical protein ACQEVZ_39900 [Dactylosporangium sp. CA-152071]|uniref:hypothetical protein n=1 Tax=Dactylosporangium sp. CA-152071 TaxID=3239933 RepID=UPI003D8B3F71
MGTYDPRHADVLHPDPAALDRLADRWHLLASHLRWIAQSLVPAVDGISWTGDAHHQASRAAQSVADAHQKTAEQCDQMGTEVRKMATQIREEITRRAEAEKLGLGMAIASLVLTFLFFAAPAITALATAISRVFELAVRAVSYVLSQLRFLSPATIDFASRLITGVTLGTAGSVFFEVGVPGLHAANTGLSFSDFVDWETAGVGIGVGAFLGVLGLDGYRRGVIGGKSTGFRAPGNVTGSGGHAGKPVNVKIDQVPTGLADGKRPPVPDQIGDGAGLGKTPETVKSVDDVSVPKTSLPEATTRPPGDRTPDVFGERTPTGAGTGGPVPLGDRSLLPPLRLDGNSGPVLPRRAGPEPHVEVPPLRRVGSEGVLRDVGEPAPSLARGSGGGPAGDVPPLRRTASETNLTPPPRTGPVIRPEPRPEPVHSAPEPKPARPVQPVETTRLPESTTQPGANPQTTRRPESTTQPGANPLTPTNTRQPRSIEALNLETPIQPAPTTRRPENTTQPGANPLTPTNTRQPRSIEALNLETPIQPAPTTRRPENTTQPGTNPQTPTNTRQPRSIEALNLETPIQPAPTTRRPENTTQPGTNPQTPTNTRQPRSIEALNLETPIQPAPTTRRPENTTQPGTNPQTPTNTRQPRSIEALSPDNPVQPVQPVQPARTDQPTTTNPSDAGTRTPRQPRFTERFDLDNTTLGQPVPAPRADQPNITNPSDAGTHVPDGARVSRFAERFDLDTSTSVPLSPEGRQQQHWQARREQLQDQLRDDITIERRVQQEQRLRDDANARIDKWARQEAARGRPVSEELRGHLFDRFDADLRGAVADHVGARPGRRGQQDPQWTRAEQQLFKNLNNSMRLETKVAQYEHRAASYTRDLLTGSDGRLTVSPETLHRISEEFVSHVGREVRATPRWGERRFAYAVTQHAQRWGLGERVASERQVDTQLGRFDTALGEWRRFNEQTSHGPDTAPYLRGPGGDPVWAGETRVTFEQDLRVALQIELELPYVRPKDGSDLGGLFDELPDRFQHADNLARLRRTAGEQFDRQAAHLGTVSPQRLALLREFDGFPDTVAEARGRFVDGVSDVYRRLQEQQGPGGALRSTLDGAEFQRLGVTVFDELRFIADLRGRVVGHQQGRFDVAGEGAAVRVFDELFARLQPQFREHWQQHEGLYGTGRPRGRDVQRAWDEQLEQHTAHLGDRFDADEVLTDQLRVAGRVFDEHVSEYGGRYLAHDRLTELATRFRERWITAHRDTFEDPTGTDIRRWLDMERDTGDMFGQHWTPPREVPVVPSRPDGFGDAVGDVATRDVSQPATRGDAVRQRAWQQRQRDLVAGLEATFDGDLAVHRHFGDAEYGSDWQAVVERVVRPAPGDDPAPDLSQAGRERVLGDLEHDLRTAAGHAADRELRTGTPAGELPVRSIAETVDGRLRAELAVERRADALLARFDRELTGWLDANPDAQRFGTSWSEDLRRVVSDEAVRMARDADPGLPPADWASRMPAGSYRDRIDAAYQQLDIRSSHRDARVDSPFEQALQQMTRLSSYDPGGRVDGPFEQALRDFRAARPEVARGLDEHEALPWSAEEQLRARFAAAPERFQLDAARVAQFRRTYSEAYDRWRGRLEYRDGEVDAAVRERVWRQYAAQLDGMLDGPPVSQAGWQSVIRSLPGDVHLRFAHEMDLVQQVVSARGTFDRVGDARGIGDRLPEAIVRERADEFRTNWIREYDDVWGGRDVDVDAWLAHEREHGDAFASSAVHDTRSVAPDPAAARRDLAERLIAMSDDLNRRMLAPESGAPAETRSDAQLVQLTRPGQAEPPALLDQVTRWRSGTVAGSRTPGDAHTALEAGLLQRIGALPAGARPIDVATLSVIVGDFDETVALAGGAGYDAALQQVWQRFDTAVQQLAAASGAAEGMLAPVVQRWTDRGLSTTDIETALAPHLTRLTTALAPSVTGTSSVPAQRIRDDAERELFVLDRERRIGPALDDAVLDARTVLDDALEARRADAEQQGRQLPPERLHEILGDFEAQVRQAYRAEYDRSGWNPGQVTVALDESEIQRLVNQALHHLDTTTETTTGTPPQADTTPTADLFATGVDAARRAPVHDAGAPIRTRPDAPLVQLTRPGEAEPPGLLEQVTRWRTGHTALEAGLRQRIGALPAGAWQLHVATLSAIVGDFDDAVARAAGAGYDEALEQVWQRFDAAYRAAEQHAATFDTLALHGPALRDLSPAAREELRGTYLARAAALGDRPAALRALGATIERDAYRIARTEAAEGMLAPVVQRWTDRGLSTTDIETALAPHLTRLTTALAPSVTGTSSVPAQRIRDDAERELFVLDRERRIGPALDDAVLDARTVLDDALEARRADAEQQGRQLPPERLHEILGDFEAQVRQAYRAEYDRSGWNPGQVTVALDESEIQRLVNQALHHLDTTTETTTGTPPQADTTPTASGDEALLRRYAERIRAATLAEEHQPDFAADFEQLAATDDIRALPDRRRTELRRYYEQAGQRAYGDVWSRVDDAGEASPQWRTAEERWRLVQRDLDADTLAKAREVAAREHAAGQLRGILDQASSDGLPQYLVDAISAPWIGRLADLNRGRSPRLSPHSAVLSQQDIRRELAALLTHTAAWRRAEQRADQALTDAVERLGPLDVRAEARVDAERQRLRRLAQARSAEVWETSGGSLGVYRVRSSVVAFLSDVQERVDRFTEDLPTLPPATPDEPMRQASEDAVVEARTVLDDALEARRAEAEHEGWQPSAEQLHEIVGDFDAEVRLAYRAEHDRSGGSSGMVTVALDDSEVRRLVDRVLRRFDAVKETATGIPPRVDNIIDLTAVADPQSLGDDPESVADLESVADPESVAVTPSSASSTTLADLESVSAGSTAVPEPAGDLSEAAVQPPAEPDKVLEGVRAFERLIRESPLPPTFLHQISRDFADEWLHELPPVPPEPPVPPDEQARRRKLFLTVAVQHAVLRFADMGEVWLPDLRTPLSKASALLAFAATSAWPGDEAREGGGEERRTVLLTGAVDPERGLVDSHAGWLGLDQLLQLLSPATGWPTTVVFTDPAARAPGPDGRSLADRIAEAVPVRVVLVDELGRDPRSLHGALLDGLRPGSPLRLDTLDDGSVVVSRSGLEPQASSVALHGPRPGVILDSSVGADLLHDVGTLLAALPPHLQEGLFVHADPERRQLARDMVAWTKRYLGRATLVVPADRFTRQPDADGSLVPVALLPTGTVDTFPQTATHYQVLPKRGTRTPHGLKPLGRPGRYELPDGWVLDATGSSIAVLPPDDTAIEDSIEGLASAPSRPTTVFVGGPAVPAAVQARVATILAELGAHRDAGAVRLHVDAPPPVGKRDWWAQFDDVALRSALPPGLALHGFGPDRFGLGRIGNILDGRELDQVPARPGMTTLLVDPALPAHRIVRYLQQLPASRLSTMILYLGHTESLSTALDLAATLDAQLPVPVRLMTAPRRGAPPVQLGNRLVPYTRKGIATIAPLADIMLVLPRAARVPLPHGLIAGDTPDTYRLPAGWVLDASDPDALWAHPADLPEGTQRPDVPAGPEPGRTIVVSGTPGVTVPDNVWTTLAAIVVDTDGRLVVQDQQDQPEQPHAETPGASEEPIQQAPGAVLDQKVHELIAMVVAGDWEQAQEAAIAVRCDFTPQDRMDWIGKMEDEKTRHPGHVAELGALLSLLVACG